MNSCLESFSSAIKVRPIRDVNAWANSERFIKAGLRWTTEMVPYTEEMMLACSSDSITEQITIVKGQQLGITEMAVNVCGQAMDENPDNILYQLPNGATCLKFSKLKLQPMIEFSPRLKNIVSDASSRDGTNTLLLKQYPGGTFFLLGSNSGSEGRMIDARIGVIDEYDAHIDELRGEGSGYKVIEGRTASKGDRAKIIAISTPKEKTQSKIWPLFLKGSQEYYYIPCPHCKFLQVMKWENFKYEKGDVESIRLKCINKECGKLIEEKHKRWMMDKANGAKWIAHNPNRQNKRHRSFHISSFYAPINFLSWRKICQKWFDAQDDIAEIKSFRQLVEGIPFEESQDEETQLEELMSRRYKFAHKVPKEVLLLTSFCDMQNDRLEVFTYGWGLNDQAWRIDKEVFDAPIGRKIDHPLVWSQLELYRKKTFIHETGIEIGISAFGIDTGGGYGADGHFSEQAYAFVKGKYDQRCFALKGSSTMGAPLVSRPSKSNKGKIPLHLVGTDTVKRTIMGKLRAKNKAENGYIHLSDTMTEEECKQMLSEKLLPKRIKTPKGSFENVKTYQKIRERNEEFDGINGAYVVMKMIRPNWVALQETYTIENIATFNENQIETNDSQNSQNSQIETNSEKIEIPIDNNESNAMEQENEKAEPEIEDDIESEEQNDYTQRSMQQRRSQANSTRPSPSRSRERNQRRQSWWKR